LTDQPPWNGVTEEDYIPEIRAAFASRLREQASSLAAVAQDLDAGDPDLDAGDPAVLAEALEHAFKVAHSIRGTAATLLGHDLGEASGRLADRTSPLRGSQRVDADALPELRRLTADLKREVERYLGWVDADG